MHDLLFANQKRRTGLKRAALDGYAARARARHGEVGGGARRAHAQGGDRGRPAAAQAAEINGTPTSCHDLGGAPPGRKPSVTATISGAQPYARFRQLVERALAASAKPPARSKPQAR